MEKVILLFVGGLALICLGLFRYRERKRLFRLGMSATGIVLQINHKGDGNYEAEIGFDTDDFKKVIIRHGITDEHNYGVGKTLKVIYDAHNPRKFLIDEGPYKPNGSGMFYAGIVLIMISIVALMTVLR